MEAKQQPECFVTMETGVCEAAARAEELLSMPLTRWVQWAIEKAFSRPRPQQRLPAHAVCSPTHSTPRRFLGEVVPICYFLLFCTYIYNCKETTIYCLLYSCNILKLNFFRFISVGSDWSLGSRCFEERQLLILRNMILYKGLFFGLFSNGGRVCEWVQGEWGFG